MNEYFKYKQSNLEFQEDYSHFTDTFIQRFPRYAVKFPGGKWNTKNKPLSDLPVKSHLSFKYFVGTLSQWYPRFAIIDIDNFSIDQVNHLMELLNLNSDNSMLYYSESPNSYHILFKPLYRDKPPTVKLLHDVFRIFASIHNIEIFPRTDKVIRLPFGKYQDFVDESHYPLNQNDWRNKLYFFDKLDDYDLISVAHHQILIPLDYIVPKSDRILTHSQEGCFLYENGLQMPNSRNDSEYKVLLYLWRINVDEIAAVNMTWKWLNEKHNNFSKDYFRYPERCLKEITLQAYRIYNFYDKTGTYPDSTHNHHHGFITKSDLIDIVNICSGNMPRMKFLYNLVRYINPRRHRIFVNVHSDKLISWASMRTYLKYFNEFEEKGILRRGTSYQKDLYSKSVTLSWNFSPPREAILYDGRSLDILYNAIKLTLSPSEFRQLLTNHRQDYSNIRNIIQDIYGNRTVI